MKSKRKGKRNGNRQKETDKGGQRTINTKKGKTHENNKTKTKNERI